MTVNPLSIDELRERIHKGEANDPLVFLEAIMGGQDPRKFSRVYDLVCDIDEFSDGDISKDDWAELFECVKEHYRFSTVSVTESHSAAKTLAEYLHPKRKQIDIKGVGINGIEAIISPLTEEEIELFKEKFNDEF